MISKKTGLFLGAGILLASVVATSVFAASSFSRNDERGFERGGRGERVDMMKKNGCLGSMGHMGKNASGAMMHGFGGRANTGVFTALEKNDYEAFLAAIKITKTITKEEFAEMVIRHKEMQKNLQNNLQNK